MLRPFNLRCEHLAAPVGLNTPVPRFGWALEGSALRQTAWQIVLADGAQVIWDSGKVADDRQLIHYSGPPLAADRALEWTLRVWDEVDRASDAVTAQLLTGLPDQEWRGEWIARYFVLPAGREVPGDSPYDNPWQARPADYLRRSFDLSDPPQRATLYITALGLHEPWLNGQRVGADVMAPGWTDYHKRVEYQAYDVTQLMRPGANVLGAILGEGWYSGRVGHNQRRAGNHYGGRPALCCELHLHYPDRIEVIASDGDWQTRQGPICYSDFLMGEMFDARRSLGDWSVAPADPTGWQPVECFTPDPRAPLREAARVQPVREVAELPARFLHFAASGAAILDLGQNIAGYVRLRIANAPEGARFTLRHAEMLSDGELYTANLRHAVATDVYIAASDGPQVFKPRFTFHGFRYVELTLPEGVALGDVDLTGIAIQTDMPVSGKITTGNALVNQLLSNIVWGQRGNFLSVPTDCPQRDERYGWSADAQVFWKTAGYNADVAGMLTKWMLDLQDGQSPDGAFPDVAPTKPLNPYRLTPQPGAPGWGDAPVLLAWEHYQRYGDRDLLQHFWPALEAWMAYILRANPDHLRRNAVHNNYGDWLSVGPATDRALIATAYWHRLADLMAQMAEVLGRASDAALHAQTATAIRAAFSGAFLHADGRLTDDTQTAHLLALDFGLLPPGSRAIAARRLVALIEEAGGHLQTGFLGVRHLCPVLTDIGAERLAVDLLLQESYPSWGFSIRHGATTIWERWDGWTPEKGFQSANMNSFNHYAYGAVGEWIWARIAGIDVRQAGYAAARFAPVIDDRIGWCEAEYTAHTGRFGSHWRIEADNLHWQITIPPNCSAEVICPVGWRMSGQKPQGELGAGLHRLMLVRDG